MNKQTKRGRANSYLTHTKHEKGITLIALVITIIVLLILVGVSINMLLEESGILTEAQKAKEFNRAVTVQEARDFWETERKSDEALGTSKAQSLEDLLTDLVNQNLLSQEEKAQILATGEITIVGKTIIFGLE